MINLYKANFTSASANNSFARMEKILNGNPELAKCTIAGCMECDLCSAVNFEEKGLPKSDSATEMKSLYGAEALSYYFYFSPAINRA